MRKIITIVLVVSMITSLLMVGCKGEDVKETEVTQKDVEKREENPSENNDNQKPDTWIADRHIVARAFIDDLGVSLPEDQVNNAVAQRIKELTGITIEWQYTAASSDREMLMTSIAAGDLGDVICFYLNDASRPEMPIVLKAAREGMFHDLNPFLKQGEIYSKYFEKDYLPNDSYKNILFREEFGGVNGSSYIVHMAIPRYLGSNEYKFRGGMYIQKSIVDSLGVDVTQIRTQDDLYDLLVKIKEGNFKDANGQPVYPLGPSIWGGRIANQVLNNNYFGISEGFNIIDGQFVHEAETDYVLEQIKFMQRLLREELIHPEIFTIDSTRAEEGCYARSYAIIQDIHNFNDLLQQEDYLPVGPLEDYKGKIVDRVGGKSGYAAWAIPSTAENPEDIVKFADFLASEEGKLLWMYGIEGEHYDMVDGKPMVKKELLELKDNDRQAFYNLNIYGGGSGSHWAWALGNTDLASEDDFGELVYGTNVAPEKYENPMMLYNYGFEDGRPEKVYEEGFSAPAYLNDLEIASQLKPLLDSYKDVRVKAFFAKSYEEGVEIIENYREQLKKAGIEEFIEYLNDIYKTDPKSIKHY